MTQTILDLRIKFNQEIRVSECSQSEKNIELKTYQLNQRTQSMNRVNETEDRILGPEDKLENLNQMNKELKISKNGKEQTTNVKNSEEYQTLELQA